MHVTLCTQMYMYLCFYRKVTWIITIFSFVLWGGSHPILLSAPPK